MSKKCKHCGKKLIFYKQKIQDGYLCKKCSNSFRSIISKDIEKCSYDELLNEKKQENEKGLKNNIKLYIALGAILVLSFIVLGINSSREKEDVSESTILTESNSEVTESEETTEYEETTIYEETTKINEETTEVETDIWDEEDHELTNLEILEHPKHVKLFDDVDKVQDFWDYVECENPDAVLINGLSGLTTPLIEIESDDGMHGIVDDIYVNVGQVAKYNSMKSAISLLRKYANIKYMKKKYKYEGSYRVKDGNEYDNIMVYKRKKKRGERDRVYATVSTYKKEVVSVSVKRVVDKYIYKCPAKRALEIEYDSKVHKWKKRLY